MMKNRYLFLSFLLLFSYVLPLPSLYAQVPGALTALNEPLEGSGYPWLSADGLRLYYNGANGTDQFFISTRSSREAEFTRWEPLPINTENDVLSCWLTADELEIWYVERVESYGLSTTLKRATRNSLDEKFGAPTVIKVDIPDGFISGPSLSQDGTELYLYNSPDFGESKLYRLTAVSETEYTLDREVEFGNFQASGAAQLAKNDLRLYLSLENEAMEEHIYVAERAHVNDPFDLANLKKLGPNINVNAPKSFQPSVSGDETEIVFTRNPDGLWDGNKLWISKFDLEEAENVTEEEEPVAQVEGEEEYVSLEEYLVEDEWEELFLEEEEIVVAVPQPEEGETTAEPTAPETGEVDALAVPEVSLVYPNPSNGVFNFEFKLVQGTKNPVLEVFSLDGTRQGTWEIDAQSGHQTIDLSHLTSGTYLYRLVTDKGMSDSGKLILVK